MYIKIRENSFRERRFFKSFPFPCSHSQKHIFVPVPEISTGIPVPDSRWKRDGKIREKVIPAGL